MKVSYIAHPIGAINPVSKNDAKEQVRQNLIKIQIINRTINLTEPETVPFAPYYLDCISMDDSKPEERQRGINNDIALIKAGFISKGMLCEITLAQKQGIPVIPMTPETLEQFKNI